MILYFSATGNSRQLAEEAASRLGTEARDMAHLPPGPVDAGAGTLGIVCPVYFYNVPPIVADVISRIRLRPDQQVWAAMTYGTVPGAAARRMRSLLEATGGSVRFVMAYRMPENYLPIFSAPEEEECIRMQSEVEAHVSEIAEELMIQDVLVPRAGAFSGLLSLFGLPVYDLIRRTRRFSVSDSCIGCGLCEDICPANAIRLTDGVPVWVEKRCWHCMGCLNRCPAEAIDYGKRTKGRRRYVNPVLRRV